MAARAGEKELPPLFKRHVRRPRLTRILDASVAQAILIIGPAGYGKTTLAAEWLQGRNAGVWYRATSASADVAAFSARLVEVLQPVMPGAGDKVLQRLRVPEVPGRMARILAELLAEDLKKWPPERWLVVDDYHLVAESAAVEEFVDWLLTLSPIQLLVTSRIRPAWASARRTLYGEITEITREQLAMTTEEANLVISEIPQRSIRPLVAEAEGWPVVIGLAASGASVAVPGAQLAESLYRFMAEELLRRESPEAQEALLRSSIPPALTAGYATALDIDLERFGDVLDRHVLVERSETGTLVLHPLFREFLQRELSQQDPDAFVGHHRTALRVAVGEEAWHEAFDLARHVSEKAAAEVIVLAAPAYLPQGRLETLEKWLTACETAVAESPAALLVQAELLIRLERLSQGHAIAAEVATTVGDQDPLAARAWTLRGQASYWQARDKRALAEQRRAVRLAKSEDDRRQALWYAYLCAQGLERDDAHEYLDALDALNREAPNASDRLRVAVGRVVLKSRRGSLAGCSELLERASSALPSETDPLVVSSFLAHSSYAALSNAAYDRARELARRASSYARTLRLTLPLHACLGYEALAELGNRHFRAAEHIFIELSHLASRVEDPNPSIVTAIVGLKIDLMKNREPRNALDPPETTVPCQPSARSEFDAIAALAAAILGEHDLAEHKLADASASQSVESLLYGLFARVITADQKKDPDADRLLDEAVRQAQRRDGLDALVLAYRSYPTILERIVRSPSSTRSVARRVLKLARDEKLAANYGFQVGSHHPITILLTRRELEVLRLMAEGLTNSEIANALVISHSTAKVHVHNLTRKLNARTRFQAVRRYEEAELAGLDER
jgi:LuxR family transcriptional regulator, maltose regulon positive regulatory protein